MEITKSKFGVIEGKNISLYKLINDYGMEVHVTNYGATVTSVMLPDKEKGKVNVVCGFNDLTGYLSKDFKKNAPYFGATVGRYCATIRGGKFADCELSKNAGKNTLHGGVKGFDKNVWAATIMPITDDSCSVKFDLLSPDGDQGFPGNIQASVTIALNNENELSFTYRAKTDQITPFSMTNHSYYNLSGFVENIENHLAKINSNKTFAMDAKGDYSANVTDVSDTPLDLRKQKKIGDVHNQIGGGIENFYLFDEVIPSQPHQVAEISYPKKKRSLKVFTTEPGMLFYTAKYTSDALHRESGEQFGKYCAFCCETHRIPNGPNIKDAKNVFLSPNEEFNSKTICKFSF